MFKLSFPLLWKIVYTCKFFGWDVLLLNMLKGRVGHPHVESNGDSLIIWPIMCAARTLTSRFYLQRMAAGSAMHKVYWGIMCDSNFRHAAAAKVPKMMESADQLRAVFWYLPSLISNMKKLEPRRFFMIFIQFSIKSRIFKTRHNTKDTLKGFLRGVKNYQDQYKVNKIKNK